MTETDWQLQEAKARFSELVKSAQREGPQHITVHGKPAAVVLSRADYDRLTKEKPSFVEFLKSSPLKGAAAKITRDRSVTRDLSL
jgi:prevent-host-death family protein